LALAQENNAPPPPSQQPAKDYYYEGVALAQREYHGGGAVMGGLAIGLALGPIGWGIGWGITSSMGANVPATYVADLDTTNRLLFEEGYARQVKKTRTSHFHVGAGVGTLVAIVVLVTAASD
jgi:hypothetical protein